MLNLLLQDMVQEGKHPLCADKFFISEIAGFIHTYKCDTIIETGTLFGHSTEFFARAFPTIPVYTCEIYKNYYETAKQNLQQYNNIYQFHMDSVDFLKTYLPIKHSIPFIFLDAHNSPTRKVKICPLLDELKIVAQQPKTVICIHDFKVPNEPKFGFDHYDIGDLSFELIKPTLVEFGSYFAYYPHSSSIKGVKDLRGRIYIVVGMDNAKSNYIDSY